MTKNDTKTQNDRTPSSKLCSACSALVKSSDLEWVQCGGMNVGMHRQPLVWKLRDKYSSDVIQMNAKYSQRLAAAARREHVMRASLEAADECLALIEDVGQGAIMDNVTVARKLVNDALKLSLTANAEVSHPTKED